jgi:hypothetical protein
MASVAAHLRDRRRAADRRFIQLRKWAALPGHRPVGTEGPSPVDCEYATEAAGTESATYGHALAAV